LSGTSDTHLWERKKGNLLMGTFKELNILHTMSNNDNLPNIHYSNNSSGSTPKKQKKNISEPDCLHTKYCIYTRS